MCESVQLSGWINHTTFGVLGIPKSTENIFFKDVTYMNMLPIQSTVCDMTRSKKAHTKTQRKQEINRGVRQQQCTQSNGISVQAKAKKNTHTYTHTQRQPHPTPPPPENHILAPPYTQTDLPYLHDIRHPLQREGKRERREKQRDVHEKHNERKKCQRVNEFNGTSSILLFYVYTEQGQTKEMGRLTGRW